MLLQEICALLFTGLKTWHKWQFVEFLIVDRLCMDYDSEQWPYFSKAY